MATKWSCGKSGPMKTNGKRERLNQLDRAEMLAVAEEIGYEVPKGMAKDKLATTLLDKIKELPEDVGSEALDTWFNIADMLADGSAQTVEEAKKMEAEGIDPGAEPATTKKAAKGKKKDAAEPKAKAKSKAKKGAAVAKEAKEKEKKKPSINAVVRDKLEAGTDEEKIVKLVEKMYTDDDKYKDREEAWIQRRAKQKVNFCKKQLAAAAG